MNNSSGLVDNSNSAFILRYITEPFLLVYYGCYSVKLTRKYFHKLEPSHILELNILFDRFVLNLYMFLTNFESLLPEWSIFCTIHHLLIYITRISIHADICAGEVNRFLFLYLGNNYHETVTTKYTFVAIGIIKATISVFTMICSFYDQGLFKCFRRTRFVCAYIRKNNFYWSTIPIIISVSITLIVCGYFVKIIRKQEVQIYPVKMKEKTNDIKVVRSPPPPPPTSPNRMIEASDAVEVVLEAIRRLNTNNDTQMLFKINLKLPIVRPKPPMFNILNVAKRSLNTNMISLCIILVNLPLSYVDIYVYMTNATCDDPFLNPMFYFLGSIAFISVISLPPLIEKRLDAF